ncbi:Transglycosylase SLT domain-containing protein [Desulfuromusa kysingii]|uniref:Transglycosylase SLT domain-containing protein n=1 Tax=Desulfuromusa kysingii TaxID=37625 RepID=A0A1H3VQG5_9BACT|nr:lytic transglycosylase domain-containing protein [Desulfuromusa kysingii]SDZ76999.1 Transglycosylase SLT domain-containing protein [Desulfuromusa kysingii]
MSIEATKMVSIPSPVTPQKNMGGPVDDNKSSFAKVFDAAVNPPNSLENSKLQAAKLAKFSQLSLLRGLFSITEEGEDEDLFSGLRQIESLQMTVAQRSHILDSHYPMDKPSLLISEQNGRSEVDRMIERVAEKVSLAPELIHSVVSVESAYNPAAVSPVGAQGLMQLMPETAKELGVQDSLNPQQNLLGGSQYLKQLLDKYEGDLDSALAAYNWGQGNVDRLGLDKMPEETRNYLTKVKSLLKNPSS